MTAECYFQALKKAKAENVAQYFADLAKHFEDKGYTQAHIFFDRNPTHKNKMQTIYAGLTQDFKIKMHFHLMAAYSPQLNLVEYVIHMVRQKILHHADHKKSLSEFEKIIKELCESKTLISEEQICNILVHIENLVLKKKI